MSAGTFARNRVLAPPIVPNTQEIIAFPEILYGALGPREAEAAAQWIDQGLIVDPLATGPEWVPIDSPPHCFDTRVWNQSSDEEDAGEAVNVPQALLIGLLALNNLNNRFYQQKTPMTKLHSSPIATVLASLA